MSLTIPSGHKLGNVCSEGRFATATPLVYTANGNTYLVATDCVALAVLPVTADPLPNPVLLPAKACNANGSDRHITINGEVRTQDKKKTEVYPLPEQEGRYPAIGQVFPDASTMCGYTVFSLDAKKLADLASALSPDGKITLLVPHNNAQTEQVTKPAVVIGLNDGNACGFGVLMPATYAKTVVYANRARLATWMEDLPRDSVRVEPATPTATASVQ